MSVNIYIYSVSLKHCETIKDFKIHLSKSSFPKDGLFFPHVEVQTPKFQKSFELHTVVSDRYLWWFSLVVYYPRYLTAGYLTGDMPGNPAANQQITSNKIDVIQDEPLLNNIFSL